MEQLIKNYFLSFTITVLYPRLFGSENHMELAAALEIALAADIVERTMGFIDRLPAASTASMQRDIMAGRPSELAAQNGAVVRIGRQAGVATPVNELLYHLLLPLERRARSARS